MDVARGIHMWRREFGAGTNWTLWAYYDANDQLTWPKNDYPKETRQYDAQGNQTERALFGTHDEPVMDLSHGYHRVSTTYDERGNWTREVYLGTNGLPVLVKGCYAAISAQWDDRSNQTEFAYWGVNGEPVRGPDNFHRRVIEYGADGKILAQKYYDAQGKELNQPSP